jgi:predicted DNA-binding transcriptional regulator YafY
MEPPSGHLNALPPSDEPEAKIRRVLPERLTRRLDAVIASLAFTATPGDAPAPDTAVLLAVADAVHHHRPIAIRYTAADGRRSDRTLHPYGLVAHAGRWYVNGTDTALGQDRTFRLDRITDTRTLPGTFELPARYDPAHQLLTSLATAPYRHDVALRIHATVAHLRTRLPASVATIDESPPGNDTRPPTEPPTEPSAEQWLHVRLRVERLDWLPAVLASLDRPFIIEQPDELRGLVAALTDRLAASARTATPHT